MDSFQVQFRQQGNCGQYEGPKITRTSRSPQEHANRPIRRERPRPDGPEARYGEAAVGRRDAYTAVRKQDD